MDAFDKARKFVRAVENSIKPSMQNTFLLNQLVIVDYQTDKQLFEQGQDSNGKSIRPYYAPSTIRIKRAKGQPTDRVTWKDTGALYKSVTVDARGEEFVINIGADYAQYLVRRYGQDVVGIQRKFLKDFLNDYILPNLRRETNDKIAES